MVQAALRPITLTQFLASTESGDRCELFEGQIIPKMSPQRFHSRTQRTILRLLEDWGETLGEIGLEWVTVLQRQGQDWVPIPDLSFVYRDRLPPNLGDEPCPVPPDLAIEIISPGQSFGQMTEKATDYLAAGVARVWIVDPRAKSITVFAPGGVPVTYRGDRVLTDGHFPDLLVNAQQIFIQAGLG